MASCSRPVTSAPTPAFSWLRPLSAPDASALHVPVCATDWFASWAEADRPGALVGEMREACSVASGAPGPVAVKARSWTGLPSGLNITSDQSSVCEPSELVVTAAPGACTFLSVRGSATIRWPTSGSCTLTVVLFSWPFGRRQVTFCCRPVVFSMR